MAFDRARRAGSFVFTIDGQTVGYIKSVQLPALKGDVASVDLGPSPAQRKHVTKMSWGEITVEMGFSMGNAMYQWMQAAFDNKSLRKNFEILMLDEDYNIVRRCDVTDASLKKVQIPAFEGKSKDSGHITLTIQPEVVRYSNGSGKANPNVGSKQKLFANTNFICDVPGLPTSNVTKIDSITWEAVHTEDAVGQFIESRYVQTKRTVSDLKFTLNAIDGEPWYKKFFDFMVTGNRKETQELSIGIQLLGTDAKEVLVDFQFLNCGPKEWGTPKLTANADAILQNEATFYCEHMKITKLSSDG